ncbi:MAG: crossover junction endodeoxyribonuclease RuvC [Deltaproteobacteria bacterium]|nr:crossover junction endodeoxyribonuclease RuvC [Deltaproteobacteria bacterium]
MRVLGIDPGSINTGYGVVEKGGAGKLLHIADGTISAGADMPLPERLLKISEGLKEVFNEFKPEAVAIESLFFSKNVRSAIMLGHARGVALLSAASNGLEVFEYAPRAVKQAVVGYGAATKDQVQKMVKALLKTPAVSKADAADALAIAICHIHHGPKGTLKYSAADYKELVKAASKPVKPSI